MEYFPSWRYHRTKEPVLVKNAEEDEALGSSWADSPAAFQSPPAVEEEPEEVAPPPLSEEVEEEEKPKAKKKRK